LPPRVNPVLQLQREHSLVPLNSFVVLSSVHRGMRLSTSNAAFSRFARKRNLEQETALLRSRLLKHPRMRPFASHNLSSSWEIHRKFLELELGAIVDLKPSEAPLSLKALHGGHRIVLGLLACAGAVLLGEILYSLRKISLNTNRATGLRYFCGFNRA